MMGVAATRGTHAHAHGSEGAANCARRASVTTISQAKWAWLCSTALWKARSSRGGDEPRLTKRGEEYAHDFGIDLDALSQRTSPTVQILSRLEHAPPSSGGRAGRRDARPLLRTQMDVPRPHQPRGAFLAAGRTQFSADVPLASKSGSRYRTASPSQRFSRSKHASPIACTRLPYVRLFPWRRVCSR